MTHPTPDPVPPPPPPTPAADDLIFVEAELIRADLQTPARRDLSPTGAGVATTGGPVRPDSEGGRAGGSSPAPGAVPGSFSLPPIPTVPSFDNGPPPRSRRTAWRMAPRPISLGEGPLYDRLPGGARAAGIGEVDISALPR